MVSGCWLNKSFSEITENRSKRLAQQSWSGSVMPKPLTSHACLHHTVFLIISECSVRDGHCRMFWEVPSICSFLCINVCNYIHIDVVIADLGSCKTRTISLIIHVSVWDCNCAEWFVRKSPCLFSGFNNVEVVCWVNHQLFIQLSREPCTVISKVVEWCSYSVQPWPGEAAWRHRARTRPCKAKFARPMRNGKSKAFLHLPSASVWQH